MKILIIIYPFVDKPARFYNLPMGLLYVASKLESLGHNVSILNLNEVSDNGYERIIKYRVQDVDAIMIGGLSVHYNSVKAIIEIVKRYTSKPIIVGGGIVTSQPDVISSALNADCFVSGEGENIIEEVLKFEKRVYLNGNQVPIEELNTLMPAYHLFNMELYLGLQRPSDGHYRSIVDDPRESALIASRGCPYNCTFCFHPTGLKYRSRSFDSVFKEIDFLVNTYDINILTIYDELFSTSKEKLVKFCEKIKEYKINWSCQLRVDSVTKDDLKMMKDSGCYILSLGIESGSDQSLKSYKKHINVSQINKTLELTKDIGIAVQGNILIGSESETLETVEESFEWWKSHKEYNLAIINAIPYPGTEMYQNAVAQGKIDPVKFLENNCPAVNCSTLSDEEYANAQVRASKLFELSNRAIATDMDFYMSHDKFDAYGRFKLSFDIKCPHCETKDRRRNFGIDGLGNGVFFCRNCFMRFFITQ